MVALCVLVVLATLIRPGAGVEALLPLVDGAVVVVVRHYFDKMTR